VFLDRDGVINLDSGYVGKIKEFEFLPGVFSALKKIQDAGYRIIIITNQSGIARGFYSKKDFLELTKWMMDEFKKKRITIDQVYFCPHSPKDRCKCRKPLPNMLRRAIKDFNLEEGRSWIIGDKMSDMEMGKKSYCKKILVGPQRKFKDLRMVAQFILNST